ncbi:MAG: hypothetical protein MUE61_15215 [Vicinamibacterales bacterium]|jgi:hypothetical protein|nr:hypothetical protein [Vicinamibacterales bacterium]
MPKITCAIISVIALTLSPAAVPAGAQESAPKIVRSKPSQPVEIDGVPCAAGYVFRFEATRTLSQCTLARDASVHNADLRKGSTVALNPDGTIHHVFLPGTTMVGEHSCRGGGHDWMTHFHPNGELRLCWLSRDEVIQGVPCSRATFPGEVFGRKYATTEFHENGALSSCVASAATDVGGRHYDAGARVTLDPDGKPLPAR